MTLPITTYLDRCILPITTHLDRFEVLQWAGNQRMAIPLLNGHAVDHPLPHGSTILWRGWASDAVTALEAAPEVLAGRAGEKQP